jgi:nicotinamidase-related amidase
MLKLNAKTTALVLIDLQKGIVGMPVAPYSGEQVVTVASGLAKQFREAGGTVALVNVGFSKDFKDVLNQSVDQPLPTPEGGFNENFFELVDGLKTPSDILITKRQWGAFYGTELDLQLRRRGIDTIVLAGIATNIGVESTARQAWEHGYNLIIVEDASSSLSAEMHNFAMANIMPLIGKVTKAANINLTA